MKIKTLVPVFGGNRMLGAQVGKALEGCSWVGVLCAGGMAELPYITARTLVVNDKHEHIITLAKVAADPHYGPKLWRALRRLPFSAEVLQAAQERNRAHERVPAFAIDRSSGPLNPLPNVSWAIDYFVCAWMSRNGTAGTEREFHAGLSFRWEAGGGDSAKRFFNAAHSLREWQKILARATFTCLDCFEFLKRCKDTHTHGLYADPPWVEDGDRYKHKFSDDDHRRLANELARFNFSRVVVRYGDHPLIRELYPRREWDYVELDGRDQANKRSPELLLVRNA